MKEKEIEEIGRVRGMNPEWSKGTSKRMAVNAAS